MAYSHPGRDIARDRAHKMFIAYARGMTCEQIAAAWAIPVDQVRAVITECVRQFWKAFVKWKTAEIRCRAMAMEVRLLRCGKDCPVDQPIETLGPPPRWMKAFRKAGLATVNQLRAASPDVLLYFQWFPRGAIDWAILKLDKVGLSHSLAKKKRPIPIHAPPIPLPSIIRRKRIQR